MWYIGIRINIIVDPNASRGCSEGVLFCSTRSQARRKLVLSDGVPQSYAHCSLHTFIHTFMLLDYLCAIWPFKWLTNGLLYSYDYTVQRMTESCTVLGC
jgi:hypothetical protein